jgi:hypothetical protein
MPGINCSPNRRYHCHQNVNRMFNFLLAIFVLAVVFIPIAVFGGLMHAYKKLDHKTFLLLIAFATGLPYLSFKLYEHKFMLEAVPDALNVSSIEYQREKSWGFGPGGNESGVRLYPLPDNVSQSIKARGIKFFQNLPQNKNQQKRDSRGLYSNWAETPVQPNLYWGESKISGNLNVLDYICYYGFCIDVKPSVVEEANSIINRPGSFYAYGRIGLIIVSPEKNLVLYFYAG